MIFCYDGDFLIIKIINTSDELRIYDWKTTRAAQFQDNAIECTDGYITKSYIESHITGIKGTSGNDMLYGNSGNNVLDGGAGNDGLFGFEGSNVFVFGPGYGQDYISSASTTGASDKIQYTGGMSDLAFWYDEDFLIIKITTTTDELRIYDWKTTRAAQFQDNAIECADGNITKSYIESHITGIKGTSGNDMLFGNSGNNILDGGAGNDGLFGYEGSNTFIFGPGYGQDYISSSSTTGSSDKIQYLGGKSDLYFTTDGDHLLVKIVSTTDELKIYDWRTTRSAQFQENAIECTDGAITKSFIESYVSVIRGTSDNDMLYGNSGNNTFDGGTGNDGLYGYEGNNTFIFGPGYGQDYISSYSTTGSSDKIQYKGGKSDLYFMTDGDHLLVKIISTTDELKIYDWKTTRAAQFLENTIECTDGTITKTFIQDYISVIRGTSGDDMLYGNSGNNTFDGGAGNDGLYGYEGNNAFIFGQGYGHDYISSYSTTGSSDKIQYTGSKSDLYFMTDGDHLLIKIISTTDELKIYDWKTTRAAQFQDNAIVCVDGAITKAFISNAITPYNNGLPSGNFSVAPVAFAYCDISNICNSQSVSYSINVLSSMPYLVTSEPGELNSAQSIVASHVKNNGTKIFGYINVGNNAPTWSQMQTKIDNIANAGWFGVFIDQFGKNPGETREYHNQIIDYIHGKNLVCFVNASHLDEVFESYYDVNFNPNCTATHLGAGDWWLDESFLVSRDKYFGNMIFFEKHRKAIEYQQSRGVKVVALSYKRSNKTWAESVSDIQMSYSLALTLGYDGWWMQEAVETDPDPVIDKYNRDQFAYARDFTISIGTSLTQPLKRISSGQFVALTNTNRIVFTPTTYVADGTEQNATMSLEQLGTTDLSNIALGKNATASSVEVPDGRFVPLFAVDGLTGSRWSSSTNATEWIKIDFGSVSNINKLIIDWEASKASEYIVYVSEDNANWTAITPSSQSRTDNPNLSNSMIPDFISRRDELNFSNVTGRYVKIECLQHSGSYVVYSIWNLEVYGTN